MIFEEAAIIIGNISVDGTDKCYTVSEYQEAKGLAVEALERWKDTRWIPVGERLPEDCVPVNVTWINKNPEPYYKDIKDVPFTDTAVYCNEKWHWWSSTCIDYLKEYGKCDWELVNRDIKIRRKKRYGIFEKNIWNGTAW
nr:MAG TPA: Protein of unknown function (DUF551) [Bacteriophage sp.]